MRARDGRRHRHRRRLRRALADAGFRVAVHYRSSEAPAREARREAAGRASRCAPTSPRPSEIDALVAALKERAGRVDVLVNNAGFNVNGLIARDEARGLRRASPAWRAAPGT